MIPTELSTVCFCDAALFTEDYTYSTDTVALYQTHHYTETGPKTAKWKHTPTLADNYNDNGVTHQLDIILSVTYQAYL